MSRYEIKDTDALQALVQALHAQTRIEGMVIISSLGDALDKGDYEMLWDTLCRSSISFDGDKFCNKLMISLQRFIPADSEIKLQLQAIIKRCIMQLRIND